jgi:hypothetical protein
MGTTEPRAGQMIVEALCHLKAHRGFTPREVVGYISNTYGADKQIRRCAITALKRGAEFGILVKNKGRYALKITDTVPSLASRGSSEELEADSWQGRHLHKAACKKKKKKKPRNLCKPRRARRRSSRPKCGAKRQRKPRPKRRPRPKKPKC